MPYLQWNELLRRDQLEDYPRFEPEVSRIRREKFREWYPYRHTPDGDELSRKTQYEAKILIGILIWEANQDVWNTSPLSDEQDKDNMSNQSIITRSNLVAGLVLAFFISIFLIGGHLDNVTLSNNTTSTEISTRNPSNWGNGNEYDWQTFKGSTPPTSH